MTITFDSFCPSEKKMHNRGIWHFIFRKWDKEKKRIRVLFEQQLGE